jgi:hypothetical protein
MQGQTHTKFTAVTLMTNSGDGKSGTQNKEVQHPESCSTVSKNKRSGEEATLLTDIPEMSATNLGRVDGYFMNILWLCKLHSSCKCWEN